MNEPRLVILHEFISETELLQKNQTKSGLHEERR